MRITILVEGKTESAFKPHLINFLKQKLAGKMPKLDIVKYDGRIPTGQRLKRVVDNLLNDGKYPSDLVIALTDVYTGSIPPEFPTATDAKRMMRGWVGDEPRFHAHVALHDFEAWLLPYWDKIQRITGRRQKPPGNNPEAVNHGNSPAYRLKEIFRLGTKTNDYVKARDAGQILRGEDLMVAINECAELRAFINTILKACDPQNPNIEIR